MDRIKWIDRDGDEGFIEDATGDMEAGRLYIEVHKDHVRGSAILSLYAERKLRKALNERRKERKAKKAKRDEAAELREFVEAMANQTVGDYVAKRGFNTYRNRTFASAYEMTAKKVLERLTK